MPNDLNSEQVKLLEMIGAFVLVMSVYIFFNVTINDIESLCIEQKNNLFIVSSVISSIGLFAFVVGIFGKSK